MIDKLSPRELEVVQLLKEGLTSKEVADRLYVSKRTVDFHCANINAKLGIKNRVQLIRMMS
mgnify:CR=1 FL=1